MYDWSRLGADGLLVRSDWDCVPSAIVLSIPSAAIMLVMLRRGAPVFPRLTLALGALASAAMVNFGLRLFHAGDVAVMVRYQGQADAGPGFFNLAREMGLIHGPLPELERLLREGRAAAQELRELSSSLRENPSQLLYQPKQVGVEIPR